MIPRVLHQIWLGAPMPEHLEAFVRSWRTHHPSWEHVLWDDYGPDLDAAPALRAAFDWATDPALKSDFLRLAAVWARGGVYVDTDIECHKPIDELLVGCDAFFACEYDPRDYDLDGPSGVNSAIFGATPRHPAVAELIEAVTAAVRRRREEKPKARWRRKKVKPDPLAQLDFGPRVFREVVHRRSDVRIFEQKLFQALLPRDVKAGVREVHPDAYGTHWYELSWLKADAAAPDAD